MYPTKCDINYFRCCHIIYRFEEVSKDSEFTSTYLTAVKEFSKQPNLHSIPVNNQFIHVNEHLTMRQLSCCIHVQGNWRIFDIFIEKPRIGLSGYSFNTAIEVGAEKGKGAKGTDDPDDCRKEEARPSRQAVFGPLRGFRFWRRGSYPSSSLRFRNLLKSDIWQFLDLYPSGMSAKGCRQFRFGNSSRPYGKSSILLLSTVADSNRYKRQTWTGSLTGSYEWSFSLSPALGNW